jgi:hypothetical protein
VAVVVAGDAGPVAAAGRTPLPARMLLDDVQYAARAEAGPELRTARRGRRSRRARISEQADGLAGDGGQERAWGRPPGCGAGGPRGHGPASSVRARPERSRRPGFLLPRSATVLDIAAVPGPGDALHGLGADQAAGLLVIEFAARRRARVNGTLVAAGPGGLRVVAGTLLPARVVAGNSNGHAGGLQRAVAEIPHVT